MPRREEIEDDSDKIEFESDKPRSSRDIRERNPRDRNSRDIDGREEFDGEDTNREGTPKKLPEDNTSVRVVTFEELINFKLDAVSEKLNLISDLFSKKLELLLYEVKRI